MREFENTNTQERLVDQIFKYLANFFINCYTKSIFHYLKATAGGLESVIKGKNNYFPLETTHQKGFSAHSEKICAHQRKM